MPVAAAPIPDAAVEVGADANIDAEPTDAGVDAPPPAPVLMELVTPFKLWERPRPKGAVNAAGEDEKLARWNVGGTGDPEFKSNKKSFHPGARVVVNTRLVRGYLPKHAPYDRRRGRYVNVLSLTSLLARSRSRGYWPFRLCFEDGLRKDQKIHGKTELGLRIGGDGRVRRSRLLMTKLPDRDVATCLTEAAKKLPYLPPPRGRSIDVVLTVEMWPGDAPVVQTDAPKGAPEIPGKLDANAVAQVLEAHRDALADCYRTGLEKDAGLWGRVQVRIEQDATGKVLDAREDESHFPDRGVSRCVVSTLRPAHFPKPDGGPLIFVVSVRFGAPPPPPAEEP